MNNIHAATSSTLANPAVEKPYPITKEAFELISPLHKLVAKALLEKGSLVLVESVGVV